MADEAAVYIACDCSIPGVSTPMTTPTLPFDDLEKAFQMMKTKEDGMIKPLITFPDH